MIEKSVLSAASHEELVDRFVQLHFTLTAHKAELDFKLLRSNSLGAAKRGAQRLYKIILIPTLVLFVLGLTTGKMFALILAGLGALVGLGIHKLHELITRDHSELGELIEKERRTGLEYCDDMQQLHEEVTRRCKACGCSECHDFLEFINEDR